MNRIAKAPQLQSGATNLLFFFSTPPLPEEPNVALQPSPFTSSLPPPRFVEDPLSLLLLMPKRQRFIPSCCPKSSPVLLGTSMLAVNSPRNPLNVTHEQSPLAFDEATNRGAALSHGDDGGGPGWWFFIVRIRNVLP
ncbi:hypothetical protein PIB30_087101 [Stylosanthes scabra]|uniref:Uncharacterized protein n=1 Tax=Stylosanthes scabra TaxID=79078 RepID=A0ABU6ZRZ6_9FABA|nr:hypothetical protein [Stylosanthes scabra]